MVLALILLVVVLVWLFVTYRSRQRTHFCRWRENRAKDGPAGRYYICMACGAETFVKGERPPDTCLRPVPTGEA